MFLISSTILLMQQNKNCFSCGEISLQSIYDFGDLPLVNNYYSLDEITKEEKFPLNLLVCKICFLVQLSFFPDPKKIYSTYHHVSGASKGNVDHLNEVAKFVKILGNNKDSILEIGSNDNTLVNKLSNFGFKCVAIDPAENINKNLKNTITDFFDYDLAKKLFTENKTFDIILGLNVFAHNDTFLEMFKGCELILNDDGILIIEVAYALETILKGNFDTIYHEHVCSYTLSSLEYALNTAGLYVHDVTEINTQGGSIRVIAKKEKLIDKTISHKKIENREEDAGVKKIQFYNSVSYNIEKKINNINKLFIKERNKKFLILGSPARGVVTLNVSNRLINNESIILDDTLEKQNKVMPGIHLPVKKWEDAQFGDFDRVLILSWNYKDDLIERLKETSFKGKAFIPFPDLIEIEV